MCVWNHGSTHVLLPQWVIQCMQMSGVCVILLPATHKENSANQLFGMVVGLGGNASSPSGFLFPAEQLFCKIFTWSLKVFKFCYRIEHLVLIQHW